MRSERGQASVEWIGTVLLVTLALVALTRLAPRADGGGLGATLLNSLVPAPSHAEVAGIRSGKRNVSLPPRIEGFTAPPLVPYSGDDGHAASVRRSGVRRWGERIVVERMRRGAGLAWRRAWFACLAYERFRYGFLHPESRFPGHTIPPAELLRIGNDCISPVDLVRDWPLLRSR